MKAITVRLPEPTYRLLADRAEGLGIPPAVLARAYIRAQVSELNGPLHPDVQDELIYRDPEVRSPRRPGS